MSGIRTLLLLLPALLPLAFAPAEAQVYRWVDEDGVVHYSDQPQPGAEEIELERAPAISMPAPAPVRRPARQDRQTDEEPPVGYESLRIASPAAEETLWNIEGELDVTLDLQPPLQPDHNVRVYFDGSPQMVEGTSFRLQEVWRGEHNLQAEVLDREGNLLIRSEPLRFYVQQTSILNPQRN